MFSGILFRELSVIVADKIHDSQCLFTHETHDSDQNIDKNFTVVLNSDKLYGIKCQLNDCINQRNKKTNPKNQIKTLEQKLKNIIVLRLVTIYIYIFQKTYYLAAIIHCHILFGYLIFLTITDNSVREFTVCTLVRLVVIRLGYGGGQVKLWLCWCLDNTSTTFHPHYESESQFNYSRLMQTQIMENLHRTGP